MIRRKLKQSHDADASKKLKAKVSMFKIKEEDYRSLLQSLQYLGHQMTSCFLKALPSTSPNINLKTDDELRSLTINV